MATYAIYTYEFEKIVQSAYKQLEIEGFPSRSCTEEEWVKRLELFRVFFRMDKPLEERTLTFGKSTFVYDVIFNDLHIAIMKLGRLSKKNMSDARLNDYQVTDYPWCYVVWDNRDGIQRMLIEQKPSAWSNTKTTTGTKKVASALKKIIDEWLSKTHGMHFNFGDGPVFKSDDFWDYVKRYPQGFSRVHFSFPPPNLGRLMNLADNIAGIRKETNGSFDADLKAVKDGVLTLLPENPQTKSLVDLSSASGSEIKAYPKGGYTMIRISGDNLENDVGVEIPDAMIPILNSKSLFSHNDLERFIEILNSVKDLY
jgi:hypothetical protein